MPTILIDRNIVSTCRQQINGQRITAMRKRELRKLNNSNNQISILLSMYEGSKARKENKDEKIITIKNEINVISKYFQKASTDCKFFEEYSNKYAELFKDHSLEKKEDDYLNFIQEMHPLLYQPIATRERKKSQQKVFEIASKYNISRQHLLVVTTLGVLYGNNTLRRIYKFTNIEKKIKKTVYNSYHDLMIISRITRIKELIKKEDRKDKVIYYSFDKPLMKFINSFIVKKSELNQGGLNIQITFDKSIFTDLNEDEFNELKNELLK